MKIKKQLSRIVSAIFRRAERNSINNLKLQLYSLIELQSLVDTPVPFADLGGWAISPDSLLKISRDITSRTNPKIIEFGSGISTLAIAAVLKKMNSGELVSIEHDPEYKKRIEDELSRLDVSAYAKVIGVPISEYSGTAEFLPFRSYDLTDLDYQFDIAFIDGPITSKFGDATRLIPLEWCISRLRLGGSLYIDDGLRVQEQALAAFSSKKYKALSVEFISTEKGMFKLTRIHQE